MRQLVIFALACGLAACGGSREEAVATAIAAMERQVAAGTTVTAAPGDAAAHYVGEKPVRYVVCGTAVLHRPSTEPALNLEHSRQRYISTVSYDGAAVATFEGRSTRPDFAAEWRRRCR